MQNERVQCSGEGGESAQPTPGGRWWWWYRVPWHAVVASSYTHSLPPLANALGNGIVAMACQMARHRVSARLCTRSSPYSVSGSMMHCNWRLSPFCNGIQKKMKRQFCGALFGLLSGGACAKRSGYILESLGCCEVFGGGRMDLQQSWNILQMPRTPTSTNER